MAKMSFRNEVTTISVENEIEINLEFIKKEINK
jgi:hypothetical protein